MKRRIANIWRPTFILIPRRVITVTAVGDEVEIRWIWGRAFKRYCVFQGRYMGITYSKTNV